MKKINLLGLPRPEMECFFESISEKTFRAKQMMTCIYKLGINNFEYITNFNKDLRKKLTTYAEIRPPEIVNNYQSVDGTCKWRIRLQSGNYIETVYIPTQDKRRTICISSQSGCALNCSFCATGKNGFHSNLLPSEIIGQLWLVINSIKFLKKNYIINNIITNVVIMGMGEPLLNLENVVSAINIMIDDYGYGLSKNKVTISTVGIPHLLDKMNSLIDVSLAISLHAPNDKLRNKLIPINKKYPLSMLIDACNRYVYYTGKKRIITIEYILISGINDKLEHIKEIRHLLKNTICKINIIPYNTTSIFSEYKRPSENYIKHFQYQLMKSGFYVTIRQTRGEDINAACGQLFDRIAF